MIKRASNQYTRQREPRRLGDVVYHAKSFIGDAAFALLLGDTTTIPECTKELIKKCEEFRTSIIAVEEVPMEKISSYGMIRGKEVEGDTYLVEDLVENPSPEEMPPNLGIFKELNVKYICRKIQTGKYENTRDRRSRLRRKPCSRILCEKRR